MTEPRDDARGYSEAEGYAASLRQQADWIDGAKDAASDGIVPFEIQDVDTDELRAAADFIERPARCDAVNATLRPTADELADLHLWCKCTDDHREFERCKGDICVGQRDAIAAALSPDPGTVAVTSTHHHTPTEGK